MKREKRSKELGLASAWKRTEKFTFGKRVRLLMYEINYAWQRAWLGYDSFEISDLGYCFARRMTVLLREYKKGNRTLFWDSESGQGLTAEETDRILDEMIEAFVSCEEIAVYFRVKEQKEKCGEQYEADRDAIREITDQNRREALKLFSKWCFQLWY